MLDQFLGIFKSNPKFKDLWKACTLALGLFHGQEQTEQGFNVNEDMLVENLKETSLIGQIIVSNHMSCFGIEIQKKKKLKTAVRGNYLHKKIKIELKSCTATLKSDADALFCIVIVKQC